MPRTYASSTYLLRILGIASTERARSDHQDHERVKQLAGGDLDLAIQRVFGQVNDSWKKFVYSMGEKGRVSSHVCIMFKEEYEGNFF